MKKTRARTVSKNTFHVTASLKKVACMALIAIAVAFGLQFWIKLQRTYGQVAEVVTHGPIVGGVTASNAKVMVRTPAASTVQLVYGTNPNPDQNTTLSSSYGVSAGLDYTTQISLDNLEPNTTYYYTVSADGVNDNSKVYSFATFPLDTEVRDFNFGVFTDLAANNVPAPAYATAATNEHMAFVMQIGDFPHFNPAVKPTPVGISNWWRFAKAAVRDLDSGKQLADNLLSRYPFVHMWDDHDYGDNNYDKTNPYRSIALQAFQAYYPSYPLPNPTAGNWHTFRYGKLAQVYVLDLRSQRDRDTDTDNANKSMLAGDAIANDQKNWLKNELNKAKADGITWNIIVSTSVFNVNAKNDDSWKLFKTERNQIKNFITNSGIKNVVILSGDIHSGGAIDNGTNSIFPELSVPHTNTLTTTCTGTAADPYKCGIWSEGAFDPALGGGYGVVKITGTGGAFGFGTLTLEAKGDDGALRKTLTIDAQNPVVVR